MTNFEFSFIETNQLKIVDSTDYTGEIIGSITLEVSSNTLDVPLEILYFDSDLLGISSVLNEEVIFVKEEAFKDGVFIVKVSILNSLGETLCDTYTSFRKVDLESCKKRKILELISKDSCEENCKVLSMETILDTIDSELSNGNLSQVEILKEYLQNICLECGC